MEEQKKSKNVVLIVIIVILLIAVIGLGGYIFVNKDNFGITNNSVEKNSKNAKNQSTEKVKADTQEVKTNSTITFDGSKSINSDYKNYTLASQGNASIWVKVDETQKVLTFSFTPTKVVEFYPLTWTSTRTDVSSSNINFEKKIVNIFFGEMGQSSSGDTLFILFEDGTVE